MEAGRHGRDVSPFENKLFGQRGQSVEPAEALFGTTAISDFGSAGEGTPERGNDEKYVLWGYRGSSASGRPFTLSRTASAPARSYFRRPSSPVSPPVRTPTP